MEAIVYTACVLINYCGAADSEDSAVSLQLRSTGGYISTRSADDVYVCGEASLDECFHVCTSFCDYSVEASYSSSGTAYGARAQGAQYSSEITSHCSTRADGADTEYTKAVTEIAEDAQASCYTEATFRSSCHIECKR